MVLAFLTVRALLRLLIQPTSGSDSVRLVNPLEASARIIVVKRLSQTGRATGVSWLIFSLRSPCRIDL